MWIKDILFNATNEHLDSGRLIAFASMAVLVGSTIWNMHLGKEINLAELGAGLASILTALVAYVYHDRKQSDAK